MNPGYAGRQELPENLKEQFRGVTMMVPDRQIIMKVKLAAAGYQEYQPLSIKFHVLYALCEQQLSKQPHYDFGLRNILSVLRTAGAQLRKEKEIAQTNGTKVKSENFLLCRTLRDMNMSKFVADDVGLFISLIADLFPGLNPDKATFPDVEAAIAQCAQSEDTPLQLHPTWLSKIVQLYESYLVRHGIMVVGAAGCGKSAIVRTLCKALTITQNKHTMIKMNPKGITPKQMYGFQDPVANEWTEGIFTSLWKKSNDPRKKGVNQWMVMDGPVDAIWIEDLNTVLDDNRMLTCANGDRIPMLSSMKIMFEPENLNNASPATVSRAGIIYVSKSDLGWKPIADSWLKMRENKKEADLLGEIFDSYLAPCVLFVEESGCKMMMDVVTMNLIVSCFTLLGGILPKVRDKDTALARQQYESAMTFACLWSFGALYETEDRYKFEAHMDTISLQMPPIDKTRGAAKVSAYDFCLDEKLGWKEWDVDGLKVADPNNVDFSSLMVPTMDAERMQYLMSVHIKQGRTLLLVGGPGTAKTSIVNMYIARQNKATYLHKQMNFSSATTPLIFQQTIEAAIDKRSGKVFGPPPGKKMITFLDDVSMPEINKWGDQVTLEIVRQLIELKYLWNLDKGKAGDQIFIEDLIYILAMNHPGGGKNDIPNRMKRHCANINVPMPSETSIQQIFGTILKLRFAPIKGFDSRGKDGTFNKEALEVSESLVEVTMDLLAKTKVKLLPTPAKFHYIFNLRDVSRVFQGLMTCPKEIMVKPTHCKLTQAQFVIKVWKHECERVFQDKLITYEDKDWLHKQIMTLISDKYDSIMKDDMISKPFYMVDFLNDADEDPETGEPLGPRPKRYEGTESLEQIRERTELLMAEHNEEVKVGKLNLVLFDDALLHMSRISRIISMPKGSALLVGVGGSGKQSLTQLATHIQGYEKFQITVSKTYNTANLLEDIKNQYMKAGFGKPVTFVFTDSEVKDEGFLEYVNMILSTGEIPGLLPKDEQEAMIGELSTIFEKRTGEESTRDKVINYFYENVRKHLHMVLCFSPVGEKFRDRALKFPALFSGTTIDWFLPWPEEALERVAGYFISDFNVVVEKEEMKQELVRNIAAVHMQLQETTKRYFSQFRRNVYVTPKSFLSFINTYKEVYKAKYEETNADSEKITGGLAKLAEAETDVAAMKEDLKGVEKVLAVAGEKMEIMVANLKEKSAAANKVKQAVLSVKNDLSQQAAVIQADRDETQKDLDHAKPALVAAESALDAIKDDDIKNLKGLRNPPNIIKRIMDAVLLLRREHINPVAIDPEVKTKGGADTLMASYDFSVKMMSGSKFLESMKAFNTDTITEETCELLFPYLEMDDFTTEMAAKASGNVAGLCDWCRAMVEYYFIAKFVAPKIEALKVAEVKLSVAMEELKVAEDELAEKEAEVKGLNDEFAAAMKEKQKTQDEFDATQAKMSAANKLINGLAGEKVRWNKQSAGFQSVMKRYIGDASMSCAFISYCGPFNSSYREKLLDYNFKQDLEDRGIPFSKDLDVIDFLVDETERGKWALQGLPTDKLSLENGIMTVRATRWPIMIDPQNQANTWLKDKEEPNGLKVVTLNDKRFRMELEDAMSEGFPLLIQNIEEEVDPVLDPVLNKLIIRTGRLPKINLPDKEGCDYNDRFKLYFTTKLANPHYTPELSAATTIIDFTVTREGLEDQLLSIVVLQERPDLEEARVGLLKEITSYKAKMIQLEAQLLHKLSSVKGNLLDDPDIIDVLNDTKITSTEVSEKLQAAATTSIQISEACEDYRQVATRGSIIYFLITEMGQVNHMYQTSLAQFLQLFDKGMTNAVEDEKTSARCLNIISEVTRVTSHYMTRALFERHKIVYTLLLALKIAIKRGHLTDAEFNTLLKGGASLDLKSQKKKPSDKIPDMAWLNLCQLSQSVPFFREICDCITRSTEAWLGWYDQESPEECPIPDYHGRMTNFQALLVVRSLRSDRMLLGARAYINEILGREYLDFPSLNIEEVWEESKPYVPLIFLLSPGSNPNAAILALAKRSKLRVDAISMGQGQEVKAQELLNGGVVNGSWVLLQNTHLGLAFMRTIESQMIKIESGATPTEEAFRLWITCEPHKDFPIGLLQLSIKMTDEPPSGVKAGLRKSFNWLNQDWLEAVNRDEWRPMLHALTFLHTIVQERRKFGALGWNIPYEFNQTDLEASAFYLRAHMTDVELRKGQVSWSAVHYMVCEIQYGGRITDNLDRRLFNTYGDLWLSPKMFDPNFMFAPGYKIMKHADINISRNEIDTEMDDNDRPAAFWMHSNADLTFRTKRTNEVFQTIIDVQPKDSGGDGGGPTREETVLEMGKAFLQQMPAAYDFIQVRKSLEKLNGGAGNMPKPLTIHLKQEIDRMDIIIGLTRDTLQNLQLAIAGTIIMSADLIEALNCIFDARVPPQWLKKSWKSSTLAQWFYEGLVRRTQELNLWLNSGRPKAYWLTGFFNPQGFLTAVQQEVTRKHIAQNWSLDDVEVKTEITSKEKEDVDREERLEEGVYIWGLYLEGADWDRKASKLTDAPPKKLFCPIPCMFVTAEKKGGRDQGGNSYRCPCYTIPARTGLNWIFDAKVRTEDPQWYWILRGVALMCTKD